MIIEKNIKAYSICSEESLWTALERIGSNKRGFLFCLDTSGVLEGVITDGDIRRWFLTQRQISLDQTIIDEIFNRQFISALITDDRERIEKLFSEEIKFVPLVDDKYRLVGMARRREQKEMMSLGNYVISETEPIFIIAEIGNNHNGNLELARRMVDEAISAGADCVKFQMRDLKALYINKGKADDVKEDLGSQYTLNLLNRFQLRREELYDIFDYCVSQKILPLCTPWDISSLEALESYGMQAYKSASADLTNHDLLGAIAKTGKPIICSTGMSTDSEISESVNLFRRLGAQFALLHCNSTYPSPLKDINLKFIAKLRSLGQCPVGYSSHDRGIYVPLAAVSMGANIIEKHFTLDRNMEGNDHRVSLLPSEFAEMVYAIRQIEMAMGEGRVRSMSQGEIINRESLGKSLFINCALRPGEVIESHMVEVRSPGRGLSPNRKNRIVGKVTRRTLLPGDILYPSDLEGDTAKPRQYKFSRPFGIPVRYHDFKTLGCKSNFDLLEFHLSFKDMEQNVTEYLDSRWETDLVVHAPELFGGDHIMDLSSADPEYRSRSIFELNRVVEITHRLTEWFSPIEKTRIIINAGGFTECRPLETKFRLHLYELIADALTHICMDGVEIIPQTMPPFPWHFGGQRFHNLFVDPDEIRSYCETYGYRVCFDTSHSKLACNHNKSSFSEFIEKIGPVSAHLHIADASGVDGEGLQIGQGEVDVRNMCKDLNSFAGGVSFIPEIWQGHKNSGEGFWQALSNLEGLL
jgi:N-acetylneuraminate synthase